MLRKLFSSIFQSMHAPSLPSPPEFAGSPPEFPPSPPEFPGPRDVDFVDTTMGSSLSTDLLLEIFLRLEPTDVIRCAGVCKPWRRAIIGNAASLRPRPDRFDPRLVLGVFHLSRYQARLQRAPGPFRLAHRLRRCLAAWHRKGGNKLAVRILAVQKRLRFMFSKEEEQGLSYQVLLNSGSGSGDVWGPVQRSSDDSEVEAEQGGLCVWMERRSTLVCRDAVYWLAGPSVHSITCTLALDVRTGRTWTTELPRRYHLNSCTYPDSSVPILATSVDGRLSLMESLPGPQIKVWVKLNGDDDQWTLQQTIEIDLSNLLPPNWPDDAVAMLIEEWMRELRLSSFCPRSGCVVGVCLGHDLLIDIHRRSPPLATHIGKRRGHDCYPYEMDCSSTYISKMKHF